MAGGYLLIGIGAAMAAMIGLLAVGMPLGLALLAYPVMGSCAIMLGAVHVSLRDDRPRQRRPLPAELTAQRSQ